jgi:hypothetical protein
VTDTPRHDWTRFGRSEVRAFGVQAVQAELQRRGFDVTTDVTGGRNVLHAERGRRRAEIHVQTRRDLQYPFWPKSAFRPRDGLFACLVRLPEHSEAEIFLIPSRAWHRGDGVLVSRDYEGKASPPEWGINLSERNLPILDRYLLERSELFVD